MDPLTFGFYDQVGNMTLKDMDHESELYGDDLPWNVDIKICDKEFEVSSL